MKPCTTFHNVTVVIEGTDPREAYTKLCDAIASIEGADLFTDTYRYQSGRGPTREGETSELFPSAP